MTPEIIVNMKSSGRCSLCGPFGEGEIFHMAPIEDDALRHNWTVGEIEIIYKLPLPDLIFQAQIAHRRHHNPAEVQGCTLLSIKTGGCPEDCAYCPQSARYQTG